MGIVQISSALNNYTVEKQQKECPGFISWSDWDPFYVGYVLPLIMHLRFKTPEMMDGFKVTFILITCQSTNLSTPT